MCSIAIDFRSGTMAIGEDLLQCRLDLIGHRACKPAQARLGICYDSRQGLFDFVRDRSRPRPR
jgi:hypothetical protein